VGTLEVHLATEFQNIILDHGAFPEDLKQQMYAYIAKSSRMKWAKGDTEEQFIYKNAQEDLGRSSSKSGRCPKQRELQSALNSKRSWTFCTNS